MANRTLGTADLPIPALYLAGVTGGSEGIKEIGQLVETIGSDVESLKSDGGSAMTAVTELQTKVDSVISPGLVDTNKLALQNQSNFAVHTNTDVKRWGNNAFTHASLYDEIAVGRGLKKGTPGDPIAEDTIFVVPNTEGGILSFTTTNPDGNYAVLWNLTTNQTYSTLGMVANAEVTEEFRVDFNDQIRYTGNATLVYTPYAVDPQSAIALTYADFDRRITQNANDLLSIKATLANKTLSGNKVDIIATSLTGYVVDNALGGRLTGVGVGAIIVSTGVVDVTSSGGITTRVYSNLAPLTLFAPAPTLVVDVADGDTIVSSGMAELFFEPYTAS